MCVFSFDKVMRIKNVIFNYTVTHIKFITANMKRANTHLLYAFKFLLNRLLSNIVQLLILVKRMLQLIYVYKDLW